MIIIKVFGIIKIRGIKALWYMIIEKIKRNKRRHSCSHSIEINYIQEEMKEYWNSYKKVRHKYLNKVISQTNYDKEYNYSEEHNRTIWWCWLQGEENCPKLQKECLKSLRRHIKDREIIIISNNNLYEYIDFPEYIKKKYKNGIIDHTHFADLIRLQLLIKYGGTWIDSATFCTGYDNNLFDKPLFVYQNLNYIWYSNKSKFDQTPMVADNWFITAKANNPILVAVRNLLFDYWDKHNYLYDYFIFQYFFTLVVCYKYKREFESVPLRSNLNPHLMQVVCYERENEEIVNDICRQSTMHKLTHKVDLDSINEDSLYYKIINGTSSLCQ